jgi:hypothetical protein
MMIMPERSYSSPQRPQDCLYLQRLPARLDSAQTAAILGFQPHDIPVLVACGLLRPLGKPAANSVKYFPSSEIKRLCDDETFLNKATMTINRHWQAKNRRVNPRHLGAGGEKVAACTSSASNN